MRELVIDDRLLQRVLDLGVAMIVGNTDRSRGGNVPPVALPPSRCPRIARRAPCTRRQCPLLREHNIALAVDVESGHELRRGHRVRRHDVDGSWPASLGALHNVTVSDRVVPAASDTRRAIGASPSTATILIILERGRIPDLKVNRVRRFAVPVATETCTASLGVRHGQLTHLERSTPGYHRGVANTRDRYP